MTKTILLLAFLTLTAAGQFTALGQSTTATVTQNVPGVVRYWPPSTPPTVLNVSLSGAAGLNVSAAEFTVVVPALSTVTAQPGAAATAAQKTITCAPLTAAGVLTCLVYGAANNTAMADGVVAALSVTLPTTTAPGTFSVVGSNLTAASSAATAVTVTAGPALALSIANPCDLNGDGVVNSVDVPIAVAQALGTQACGVADLIGTGVCTGVNGVIDVVRTVIAETAACKVGP